MTVFGFKSSNVGFPKVKKLKALKSSDFLLTLEHHLSRNKNSIYCSSFLSAWDEIRDLIKTPLEIDSSMHDLYLVNKSKSHLNALLKSECTVTTNVTGGLIMVRASFQKPLPFEEKLTAKTELAFNEEKVESFGAIGYSHEASETIQIIYYANDNDFILNLKPKNKEHEIILSMSPNQFNSMTEIKLDIERRAKIGRDEREHYPHKWWKFILNEEDEVAIPKLQFNIETNYPTLEGKTFKSGSTLFQLSKAYQRTAFLLDEKGAKIESEGIGEVVFEEPVQEVDEKTKPKKMRCDKPFFLMMKRTDTDNPYFGIWVANTELMQLKK